MGDPVTDAIEHALDVRAIRRRLGLGQNAFARRFGLAVRTVQEWEQGRRVPDGPGHALLRIIERDAEAAARALSWVPDDVLYAARVRDVRDLVAAEAPDVVYIEGQPNYPSFRLGLRHVAVGLAFWPWTSRSCILVNGNEQRWFDFDDPVLTVAECVLDGLAGAPEPPALTFERYVGIADHAMRSVLAGRARVELVAEEETGPAVLWRGERVAMRLSRISEYGLMAKVLTQRGISAPPPMEEFLEDGSAVRFGGRDLAALFAPTRRR